MGISKKISIASLIAITVVVLVLYLFLDRIFSRSFVFVEQWNAEQSAERVIRALDSDITTLKDVFVGWAQWDETYNYLLGRNPEYIDSNVTPSTYVDTKINSFYLIKNDGTIVFEGSTDAAGKPVPIPAGHKAFIGKGSVLTTFKNNVDTKQGIVLVDGVPYAVVSESVTNSNHTAPSVGALVVFRLFDESVKQSISDITKLNVNFKTDLRGFSGFDIRPLNDQKLVAKTAVKDIYGHDALLAVIEMERDVFNQGQKTINILLISLITVGILLTGLTIFLINIFVMAKTKRLSLEVSQRRESLDFGRPLTIKGSDELGQLATSINQMMSHVDSIINKHS